MDDDKDPLTKQIIGCAIEVHKTLGPGLLESAYEQCLVHELGLNGIPFRRQVPVPLSYKGISLECGYRIDIIAFDSVVLELKAVEALLPVHSAQILTYLRLTGLRTGLLINFGAELLKDGIQRFRL